MIMNTNNKSAKDIAFDKERAKYHKKIRELERELKNKDNKLSEFNERAMIAEQKCDQLQEWIDRLLEYTEMSEEDMKRIIQKDKDTAEAMRHFNDFVNAFNRFRGGYL